MPENPIASFISNLYGKKNNSPNKGENAMDYIEKAIELVKAQASIRMMTDEEILKSVANIAEGLKSLHQPTEEIITTDEENIGAEEATTATAMDAKKSIRAKSITCLECGKVMKVLGNRHLALHGLDAVSYREKYGFKKGTPLCAKDFVKARREKMAEMRLWERKGKKEATE